MTLPLVKQTALMTAEELERVDLPGKVTELIRGQLIVREPPGTRHGMIAATLCIIVGTFVRREKLGAVFAQDTGFKIESDPDTVRAPDVAYLSTASLGAVTRRGYAAIAPDLAAEVVSPDDRAGDVLSKVATWLSAGSRLVWVVDPDREEVRVYRPDGSATIVAGDGSIGGEDVLPGFTCSVRDILS
ncbi:MAG: Uma2 family endonuclease [Gemmatimonadaceae bacterium]